MTTILRTAPIVAYLALALPSTGNGADTPKDALQGVWVGKSLEADGKPAPEEAARRMRFTFKGGKLFLKGNFDDDREEECTYMIDPKQTPKHLDFTPPKEKKPVLAIYEEKGEELMICLRHASSTEGRPTEFATKAGSKLVLLMLQKQKP